MRSQFFAAIILAFISSGCIQGPIFGATEPRTLPPGGSIFLRVSVPGNARAAIRVTGPNGFDASVTGTTSLGGTSAMLAGWYTITASNISVGTAMYAPVPAVQELYILGYTPAAVWYCSVPCPWTTRAAMPTPRSRPAAATVNGIVYVVGGVRWVNGIEQHVNTVEAYDPATDTWSTKAPMPTGRDGLGVGVVNGILYAAGGQDGERTWTGVVEAYNPTTDRWTTKAPMPTAKFRFGMAALNGKLYAVGGAGDVNLSNSVEEYDPAADRWTSRAPMTTGRDDLAVGAAGGLLFAVGGGFGFDAMDYVEAYDPALDRWESRAPLHHARGDLALTTMNGVLYAIGGTGRINSLDTDTLYVDYVEAYDPASNRWKDVQAMPSWRTSLAAAAVGGTVYVVGGGLGPYYESGVLESFTPR